MNCEKCIHYEVCYSVAECLNYLPNFSCNHYSEERPQGEWIRTALYGQTCYECDNCHLHYDLKTNFCPNCGADMRGENKECTDTN